MKLSCPETKDPKLLLLICLCVAALGSLFLLAMALFWAPLNQDEGWYLFSALRVSQGFVPYEDFAFTQGPVFPYVGQAALPLVHALGLLGGRVFCLLCYVVAATLILFRLRKEESPLLAMLLAVAILGLNPYAAQYAVTVKTYSMAGLWLCIAMLFWFQAREQNQLWALLPCAAFLGLATATRLSLGLFFVPLGLNLLFRRGEGIFRLGWILFGASGILVLVILFGPFFLLADEGLYFGLIEFHTSRTGGNPWLFRAGFLSRVLQSWIVALPLCSLLLCPKTSWRKGTPALAWSLVMVTVLHLFSPFPYDDYQMALAPALALLLALEVPGRLPQNLHQALAQLFLIFALGAGLASPQIQSWFSQGRDRIWWQGKESSELRQLQLSARELRELDASATLLLTQDLYLAIEARMDVPAGFEMGPFCLTTEMDPARAARLRLMTPDSMAALIRDSSASLAATSGYSFSIDAPSIEEMPASQSLRLHRELQRAYRPKVQIDHFGQAGTTLELWQRIEAP